MTSVMGLGALVLTSLFPVSNQTPCAVGRVVRATSNASVTIGSMDGADPFLFRGIAASTVFSDGTFAVANSYPPEVRFFSADGKFVGKIGKGGSGSELRQLSTIVRMGGDSILASDVGSGRLVIIGHDGTVKRAVALPKARGAEILRIHHLTGSRVAVFSGRAITTETGTVRDSLTAHIIDLVTLKTISLGVFPGQEYVIERTQNGIRYHRVGFARGLATTGGRGRLYIAPTDSGHIQVYDSNGVQVQVLRAGAKPHEPSLSEKNTLRNYLLKTARTEWQRVEGKNPHIAKELPVISTLHMDQTGRLWVERYAPPWERSKRVFDLFTNGVKECVVEMPFSHTILEISADYALLLRRDEFDVEQVTKYMLSR